MRTTTSKGNRSPKRASSSKKWEPKSWREVASLEAPGKRPINWKESGNNRKSLLLKMGVNQLKKKHNLAKHATTFLMQTNEEDMQTENNNLIWSKFNPCNWPLPSR